MEISLVKSIHKELVEKLIKCANNWKNSKPLLNFVSCEISNIIRTQDQIDIPLHTYIKFNGPNCSKDFEFIYYLDHDIVKYKISFDVNCGLDYYDSIRNTKTENFNNYEELTNSLLKIIKAKNDK